MQKANVLFSFFLLFLLACVSLSAQVIVKNINPGSNNGLAFSYQQIVKFNSLLYFSADDGVHGRELWKSNGVGPGTQMVIDLNSTAGVGSNPQQLTVIGNRLFFVADDGVHGRELWVINGSSAPQLLELEPSAAGATIIRSIISVGSEFYFLAATPSLGDQLWKYDGTNPPQAQVFAGGIDPVYLLYGNDHIWGHWDELAYEPVTQNLYWFGQANSPQTILWKYQVGVSTQPSQVGTFDGVSGNVQPPVTLNGFVYFPASASPGNQNMELFRSDGLTISLSQDIVPGNESSAPGYMTLFHNNIYFLAHSAAFPLDQSIWKFDGTNPPTLLAPSIFDGAYGGFGFPNENPFRIIGNQMYIQKNTDIYLLNGTGMNVTLKLHDFLLAGINESGLIKSGNKYFYSRYENNEHPQVIKDDGSGPVAITNFDGTCDCSLHPFILRGNRLYFPAHTVAEGWELWKLDPSQFLTGPDPTDREAVLGKAAGSPAPFFLGPNPADESCTLRFGTPTVEGFALAIFDNAGKKVVGTNLPEGVSEYLIPTANLPKGLYFIQLSGEKTKTAYHERMVVSH